MQPDSLDFVSSSSLPDIESTSDKLKLSAGEFDYKTLQIFKARCLHCVMGCLMNSLKALILKAIKPALGRCGIPTISFAAHRANHTKFLEPALKHFAGILTATDE